MSLDRFGVEASHELRRSVVDDHHELQRCPCGRILHTVGTVSVDPSRLAPDVFDDIDTDVLVRGWECPRSDCNRDVVDTFEVAQSEGRVRDLAPGWYPIRAHLDAPDDTAIVFAPKDHVDDLLGRDQLPNTPVENLDLTRDRGASA